MRRLKNCLDCDSAWRCGDPREYKHDNMRHVNGKPERCEAVQGKDSRLGLISSGLFSLYCALANFIIGSTVNYPCKDSALLSWQFLRISHTSRQKSQLPFDRTFLLAVDQP